MARRPARRADRPSELLTLSGVTAVCADCGDERLFLPTDDASGAPGEYCCTSCDAAVFLLAVVAPAARGGSTSHVA